jgi:HU domain fused to wHTH, Ig, or Glycine-rich motif
MAKPIKAITTYRPRILRGQFADVTEVSNLIGGRTSINPGSVQQALMEFLYVLAFFLNSGRPVSLPGIGLFTPSIALDGTIKVNLRVDKNLSNELNKKKRTFKGKIHNMGNIGKTSADLIVLWNENNPDDLIV